MNNLHGGTRAVFVASDGNLYPDYDICSGKLILDLAGQPCPFSQDGQLPEPQPLDTADPAYSRDKGNPGDLCPPCARQQSADLGHWEGYKGRHYPEDLKPLRVFKCNQWLWLVVVGLRHDEPTRIQQEKSDEQE